MREEAGRSSRTFALALLLALTGLQAACVPLPWLRAPEVSGRVVDADSGLPVAGAIVVVRYDARYEEILPDRDLVGHGETVTASDGSFALEGWLEPGLSVWPLIQTEARIMSVLVEGYRCGAPVLVPDSRRAVVQLHRALDIDDRRGSCRPVTARPSEAPRYTHAWRALYPRRQTAEQAEEERQVDRLLAARAVFGFGENCDGPVRDLALAPEGNRAAYLAVKRGVDVVGVVALRGSSRHEARLPIPDDELGPERAMRRLAWTGPGELVLWFPASQLDRAISASVFAAAAPEVLWRSNGAPAAPLPSLDPAPVEDRLPPRPLDPAQLNDEGEARWLGRSFTLTRQLDPISGLAADALRVTEEDGRVREVPLPGEACGPRGEFGQPHYRIAADGRSALDLRHVKGGCRSVAIDLTSGSWTLLDDVGGRAECRETRRIPASQMNIALRSYSLEVEGALQDAGADPSAAYTLRIAKDGDTVAVTKDYAGEARSVAVPMFPIQTPLRRVDVSVVGGGGTGGSRQLPGIEPL